MAEYVGAIDQGTTSSRFILFDRDGRIVQVDQREHEQITPRAGWVEHDPKEVWRRTREVIGGAMASSDCEAGDIAAIGITNQRETTVVWDRETGEPVYNAIVWQDTRTGALVREFAGDEGVDRLRDITDLPLTETTALGAAYAAGLASGFWSDQDELRERWSEDKRWEPAMDGEERDREYAKWKKAVERTLDWADE